MPLISLITASSATMLAFLIPIEPKRSVVRTVPVSNNPNPIPKGNPGQWVSPNDYPAKALVEKAEGATGFRLVVDKNGNVSDCSITQSSGNAYLDATTCIKIFIRGKFIPAKDEAGAAIAGAWSSRVRWQIPQETDDNSIAVEAGQGEAIGPRRLPLLPGSAEFKYTVKADGAIADCSAVLEGGFRTSQEQNFDFCRNITRAKFEPSLDENGKALDRRVIMKNEIKVETLK